MNALADVAKGEPFLCPEPSSSCSIHPCASGRSETLSLSLQPRHTRRQRKEINDECFDKKNVYDKPNVILRDDEDGDDGRHREKNVNNHVDCSKSVPGKRSESDVDKL